MSDQEESRRTLEDALEHAEEIRDHDAECECTIIDQGPIRGDFVLLATEIRRLLVLSLETKTSHAAHIEALEAEVKRLREANELAEHDIFALREDYRAQKEHSADFITRLLEEISELKKRTTD